MNNKNYNFRLAEEMVNSIEDDLKDIFHNVALNKSPLKP